MLEEIDIYTKLGLENKTSILNSPQIINKYDLQWNTTGIELDKRFNLDNKNMIKGYFFDVKFLKEVNFKKKNITNTDANKSIRGKRVGYYFT